MTKAEMPNPTWIDLPDEYKGLDVERMCHCQTMLGLVITHPQAKPYVLVGGKWHSIDLNEAKII